jgi:hypothetical protein
MRNALLAALLLAARPARCAPGESALEFLRLDAGPREVAMAGAATAAGEGAHAAAYNPALLAWGTASEAAFSRAQWLLGTSHQDLAYAGAAGPGGPRLGLRLQHLDYGDLDAYDSAGARSGSVSAGDLLLAGSFARRLGWAAAGATLKLARETIAGVSAQAVLADLGGAARLPAGAAEVSFGLALKNLGPSVRFDRDSAPPPTELALGAALRSPREALTLSGDVRLPARQGPAGALGLEWWLHEALALRLGFEVPMDEGPGVRTGLGLRSGRFRVDYAFFPLGALGMTHHVGASLRFGGPAEAAYARGMRRLRTERYAEAALEFNEALRLEPRHPRAARRLRQAYRLMREDEPSPGGPR